ncbi:response regulator [Sanguibacter suaedae]|uniref:Response regulator transcription factor n=1 Tax=Sanguibacter suaedae TaxID=2795737 RepID=A0A934M9Y4_9MICO|nr:response regulator transcription factor [Sanguibacter suaedae]MBI9113666.1 response regulator transcription factor [Sanguibacter suaedae]
MTGDTGTVEPDDASSIRVMLVDDQELFREGVRIIVDAQPGMHVVGTAGDGHQALRMAAELHPDVVLMDLRMPVLDGVEATRRLLAPDLVGSRATPLRVVVLTTFDLDDRAATAIRHGASGFLLKDTTPLQLADAIRTVHAGNAVLGPNDLIALLDSHGATRDELPHSYQRLTEKERDVLVAVARGLSNAEMAQEFFLAESTIKTHVGSVLRKLGLRDRVQAVVFAHRHGLT